VFGGKIEGMPKMVMIHDIVENNGKTIRENNLEKPHNIPLGTLVEAKWEAWFGEGGSWKVHARMWVVLQGRDCDGTPLYSISRWNDLEVAKTSGDLHGGFSESSLTPVEITPDLLEGVNALQWGSEDCQHEYEGFSQPGTVHGGDEYFLTCKHCGAEKED
jgi:hypothetical protein